MTDDKEGAVERRRVQVLDAAALAAIGGDQALEQCGARGVGRQAN